MNVVVTGGAGYLGSVVVRKLLERGCRVRVIDTCPDGDASLPTVIGRLELVRAEPEEIQPLWLRGADAVIHLAGMPEDSVRVEDATANWRSNVAATLRLAFACRQAGVTRFTYASTCEVYAGLPAGPDCDEATAVAPHSPYAASKLAAERGLLELCDGRLCPVILRHGTAYGLSARPSFGSAPNCFVLEAVSRRRVTLSSDASVIRPFVDVADLAEAHVRCLEAPEALVRGQIFNVVHANLGLGQVARIVAEVVARDHVPVPVLPPPECDGSRARCAVRGAQPEEVSAAHRAPRTAHASAASLRACGEKLAVTLGFRPHKSLGRSIVEMVRFLTRPTLDGVPGSVRRLPDGNSGSYSCWVEGP